MTPFKTRLVVAVIGLLTIALPIFLVTGYSALYYAWVRGSLEGTKPYLPWARSFGMLAMAASAMAISPKLRIGLSILVTATIAFFSEFGNDGKFYFRNLVHFFGPGTWIHDGMNRIAPSVVNFLYRLEYSHWNDFLMGPAIVSVLFVIVFAKIYAAFRTPGSMTSEALSSGAAPESLDSALRFARILMNVGLFWFFLQAWGEKAGYLRNPHSSDEIDLPFEFAGTILGFWMARVLTAPFGDQLEKFRSTLRVDFVASGVVGLLYTLIVGPLTEGVASSIAHSLSPVVPHYLDIHEYTSAQRHLRPIELLLLAGAMWWGLNASSREANLTQLSTIVHEPERDPRWDMLITTGKPLAVTTAYLVVVLTMLSILEPEGLGWTLAMAIGGMAAGTAALLLVKRADQRFSAIFGSNGEIPGN